MIAMRKHPFVIAAALAACTFASRSAYAVKPYTLVEDGYPEVVGTRELENTFESLWHSRDEHHFKEFSMEHELEFQPAEKFALRFKAAYVYEDNADFEGLHFDDGGVEFQYYFTNPNIDPIGISVIGAAAVGERGFGAFEAFLVLQKDWDKFTLTYNLGAVTEIENAYGGGTRETSGTLVNSLGGVYSIADKCRVGLEGSMEMGYTEWRTYDNTIIYAGPVFHYVPSSNLWITAGIDYQVTGERSEPQYRASVIVGYYF
jgi:hypothetical protein